MNRVGRWIDGFCSSKWCELTLKKMDWLETKNHQFSWPIVAPVTLIHTVYIYINKTSWNPVVTKFLLAWQWKKIITLTMIPIWFWLRQVVIFPAWYSICARRFWGSFRQQRAWCSRPRTPCVFCRSSYRGHGNRWNGHPFFIIFIYIEDVKSLTHQEVVTL